MADISVDVSAAVEMFDQLEGRAGAAQIGEAVRRAADQGAGMVSGIPQDTGQLAGSVRAFGGRIVATARNTQGVPYGRFVFGGTSRMPARPANVPEGQIGDVLAEEIRRVIFG